MIKKILFTIIILALFSFQENDQLIGKWKVTNYYIGKTQKKKPNKWIKFLVENKLEGGDFNSEEVKKNGIWKLDVENKTLSIESEKKSKDEGKYFYQFKNNTTLILSRDSIKVYLTKI